MGALGETLTRLSTGLKINSGKDDPAGLIASELLKAQITGTTKAITNTQRANALIATADSSLGQISNLLNDIKGLVVEAANTGTMTADQIAANQLQVDAALDSIDRIARTTNYGGKKLLDGSMDFRTAGMSGGLGNVQINAVNFGTASSIGINVNVTRAADYARLISNGTGVGVDTTFDVIGNRGSATINVGAGTSNADIAAAINRSTDSTGVLAYVEGLAQRGSVVLSSAGANNDILITANEVGLENGNYTFRITKSATGQNDARIVSDPLGKTPGVVEVSLVGTKETAFNDFAGLFNITIDATYGTNTYATPGATSVSMTRGDSNKVQFFETASDASGVSKTSGATLTANSTRTADVAGTSAANGWTIKTSGGTTAGVIDQDNKTIYFVDAAAANAAGAIQTALRLATEDAAFTVTMTGTMGEGDSITFANGGSEGELFVQYKAGATAGEIQAMINNAPSVQATLKQGVSASDIISALPSGRTHTLKAGTLAVDNPWVSGATSQQVIDLINSKLGDKFTATALAGGGSGGRVSYMDASAVWGDINLGNALLFSGMDNGPLVRLSTMNSDGSPAINQKLGVKILQPSEADKKAGITTPILEIQLATDAQGNSITTARDIVDLFNKLTPAETLGVSVSQLYPPGVDPNGRIFGVDECGKSYVIETCPSPIDGIVQPTGAPGICGTEQGDLMLLGNNQKVVADYAFARIGNAGDVYTPVAAVAGDGTETITFGNSSALNGISFAFTQDERMEGFNKDTGLLTVFLNADLPDTPAGLLAAINSSVKANWEAIRVFTGSTLLTPGAEETATATTLTDIAGAMGLADPLIIDDTDGVLGFGAQDPAMVITAKDKGTDMAGVNIYFQQDGSLTAFTATTAGQLVVEYNVLENGEKQLIIKGNMGALTEVDNDLLVTALNANTDFNKLFEAVAFGPTGDGKIVFKTVNSNAHAVTEGGYRIESDPTKVSSPLGTSSGISMFGQSDANERLVIESEDLGSSSFVEVNVIRGYLNTVDAYGGNSSYSNGSDMVATINGLRATTSGNNISVNSSDLALSMNVANGVGSHGFTITGGGALFQLGPDVVSQQQMRLGIGSMLTTALGGQDGTMYMLRSGEAASLDSSDSGRKLADRIVMQAISNVANIRGRLGAIQRGSLEPNISALQDSMVALTEANAMITNADFAVESSNLTRLQLLIQAGAQTLGIANQMPQYAASLIR